MTHPSNGYVVYVDESGDHGLKNIDPHYPIFVLAFCIFRIDDYVNQVVPACQHFKFGEFGHDAVILHERDIRKEIGPFAHLKPATRKRQFLERLTEVIRAAPFRVIATVIRKEQLQQRYQSPRNPYDVALAYGLERVHFFLGRRGHGEDRTHVVFERRGKREDRELELEFRRVCSGQNGSARQLPFEIQLVDKKANSSGLQLADLIARPIGMSVLRPDQHNRAFEMIRTKLDRSKTGKIEGWGLKCFP